MLKSEEKPAKAKKEQNRDHKREESKESKNRMAATRAVEDEATANARRERDRIRRSAARRELRARRERL